jgi:hypothetical protein
VPDARGKLSEEEMAKVEAWFKKNWTKHYTCPVCGSDKWTTNGHLGHAPPVPAGWKLPQSIPTTPFVMVHSPCGYVTFFNAVIMGLWKPYVPPADTEGGNG